MTLRLANELPQRVRKSASAPWGKDIDGIVLCLFNLPMSFINTSLTTRSINQFPYLQHIYKKCLKALSKNTNVPVKSLNKQEGWRGRNQ